MVSFTFVTQHAFHWTSATSCFVFLAALCCCNGLPHQYTASASAMRDTSEQQDTVAVDLGALLDAEEHAIVTLVAGYTRLAVHRAVLAVGSPTLAAMFPEGANGVADVPGVEGPVLRQLVAFLYTGRAPQQPGMALQLLSAAEKYGVSALKNSYKQYEQELAAQLSVENAAATAVLAMRYGSHSITEAAVAFIRNHLEVVATKGWADAVDSHPGEIVKIVLLLAQPPAETSTPTSTTTRTSATTVAATTTTTAATTTAATTTTTTTTTTAAPVTIALLPTTSQQTPPLDAAAIALLQGLPAEEKAKKLIRAAGEGSVQELRALIAAGADVEARDGGGWTALHWAADYGHLEVARFLLQAGAQVDARDKWQWTPLHWAADRGHTAVVQLLLAKSADPNARDVYGATSLHWAAVNGRTEVVVALLKAGADRSITSKKGQTALDLAKQRNHLEVIRILEPPF